MTLAEIVAASPSPRPEALLDDHAKRAVRRAV